MAVISFILAGCWVFVQRAGKQLLSSGILNIFNDIAHLNSNNSPVRYPCDTD